MIINKLKIHPKGMATVKINVALTLQLLLLQHQSLIVMNNFLILRDLALQLPNLIILSNYISRSKIS